MDAASGIGLVAGVADVAVLHSQQPDAARCPTCYLVVGEGNDRSLFVNDFNHDLEYVVGGELRLVGGGTQGVGASGGGDGSCGSLHIRTAVCRARR